MTESSLRIALCLKATPDPDDVAALALARQLRPDGSGLGLRLGHVPIGVHGFDAQALGFVAAIRRAHPRCQTLAISVDPSDPETLFRSAFELGIDEGWFLDSGGAASTHADVAELLADAVREFDASLVVLGDASSDDGNGVIGGMLAALLERPCVAAVANVDVRETSVHATRRRADGGGEVVSAPLPAIVTVRSDELDPPRPKAQEVLAARDRQHVSKPVAPRRSSEPRLERLNLAVDGVRGRCEMVEGVPATKVATVLLDLIEGDAS